MTKRASRRWLRWAGLLVLLGVAVLAKGYWNATRDPVVRTANVGVASWPEGQEPLKVLLISDTHVAGPDMPPRRLARIVGDLNRLTPDLILIAGDLVSEKRGATHVYQPHEVVAPLAAFSAPLGVLVVPGNHDHWFRKDALRGELQKRGLSVLQNDAVRRGPFIVGGVDDDHTGHADIPATLAAMDRLGPGVPLLLTHSPDVVPELDRPMAAIFAGHTHCGQIRFPWFGAITYVSRYGDRFACGDITDDGQRIFVGAGLGTSVLPLRYLTPPDAWLVTIGPARAAR